MKRPALAISERTSLEQAVALMTRHRISALPVVDADNRPIGILTQGDLLRRAETGKPGWLTRLLRTGRMGQAYVQSHKSRVGEIMTRDVLAITEDTPLTDLVDMMRKYRVKEHLALYTPGVERVENNIVCLTPHPNPQLPAWTKHPEPAPT